LNKNKFLNTFSKGSTTSDINKHYLSKFSFIPWEALFSTITIHVTDELNRNILFVCNPESGLPVESIEYSQLSNYEPLFTEFSWAESVNQLIVKEPNQDSNIKTSIETLKAQNNNNINILVSGSDDSGKTTLINKYSSIRNRDEDLNSGSLFPNGKEIFPDSENQAVTMWEIADRERFPDLNRTYIESSKAMLGVFNPSNIDSLLIAKEALIEFKESKESSFDETYAALIAIKLETEEEPNENEKDAKEWARQQRLDYFTIFINSDNSIVQTINDFLVTLLLKCRLNQSTGLGR